MRWNKILLIRANFKTVGYDFFNAPFPPLALEYLAAYVEDLVDVKIIDATIENLSLKQFKQRLQEYQPDLVGFTVPVTSSIVSVLRHVKIAKQLGFTTVIGGWHPSLDVEGTLSSPWVDILVRGEGEFTFRELIEKGSPEDVLGLSYKKDGQIIHNDKRPFLKNLDELLPPARHLIKHYSYEIFNSPFDEVETSRGCPQKCKFCSTHVVYHGLWRPRTVGHVIKEIEAISSNRKIGDIMLVDDNLLVDMRRVGRLCIEIIRGKREGRIRKDAHFFFQGRLDSMAKHPYVVKLMGLAGFWLVLVGIEGTNDKTLEKVKKNCTIADLEHGLEELHKNGIIIIGNVILGVNLNNTVEDELLNIKRMAEMDVDFPSFTLLTPFPSTGFHTEMKEQNLLLTEDYSQYNWLTPVIKTTHLTPTMLRTLLFLGYKHVGYYGGRITKKFRLLKRIIRARSVRFLFSLNLIKTSIKGYLNWRKMVDENLTHVPIKVRNQLFAPSIKHMKGLKDAILAI